MSTTPLHFDRPHTSPETDWLGFPVIAKGLAKSLVTCLNERDSLVVGIEGPWGSGKSTLAGYVIEEVKNQAPHIEIVELSPWLSGDHETLASALLAAIGEAIERKRTLTCWGQVRRRLNRIRRSKWTKTILQYGARTARATQLIPGANFVEPWLSAGASAMQSLSEGGSAQSTADLKRNIAKGIVDTKCRFLVVIDDLDRLEPAQAAEVVRVVRSVADFPQMLHLLCYDREILSHAIQVGLDVPDGGVFLEKVIQLSLPMPLPEAYSLQAHLEREARKIYSSEHQLDPSDIEAGLSGEITRAIRDWGYLIRTPRQVKLVLNHLQFSYPQLAGRVNFADLCSVSLIKASNRALYQWIERYLVLHSISVGSDFSIAEQDRSTIAEGLKALVPTVGTFHPLRRLVPSIPSDLGDDLAKSLFISPSTPSHADYEAKRLCSPYHYRYYFASSGASGVLPEEEWKRLLSASKRSADAATSVLDSLQRRNSPTGGDWLGLAIDWIISRDVMERLDLDQIRNLLSAVSNLLDTLETPLGDLTTQYRWRRSAPATLIKAISRQDFGQLPEQVDQAVLEFMEQCRSPMWLITTFFRSEMYSHGFAGERPRKESEWLLSGEAFGPAVDIIWTKLKALLRRSTLLQEQSFASLIYAWHQLLSLPKTTSGEMIDVNAWIAANIKTDAGFLTFLTAMRSQIYTSDHTFFILRGPELDSFSAMSDFRERLKNLAEKAETIEIRDRAKGLQHALELAKEY